MNRGDQPIGVFDSGIGGLTVVRALRRMGMPRARANSSAAPMRP